MKKIAIVGSGIAGVSTSYYLNKLEYNVSLFEAGDHFGGHTHTHQIDFKGTRFPVDTGFLVHNDRTYPNLIDFFKKLDISTHSSDMSFSVYEPNDNITWAGTNLMTLFGQYRNILSPRFYSFVAEIIKFNKASSHYLEITEKEKDLSLGDLLSRFNYSDRFKRWYLLPMGGCIWSTPIDKMLSFPAHTFLRFCMNHGLLQVTDRPQWKTVKEGCKTYVDKALTHIDQKYLNREVSSVMPLEKGVLLRTSEIIEGQKTQKEEFFDACFFCCHPPQTLEILKDVDLETRDILSHFTYQLNKAVLHWDKSILPSKRFWSAWNYRSEESLKYKENASVSVSYLINMLQPLPVDDPVIVTLNPVSSIDPDKVWKELDYEHPVFDGPAIKAQEKVFDIQGKGNLYFSGAWMRYGFHEDGIWSAKMALNQFLENEGHEQGLIKVLG